jgi:prepilin-type N-terminal cleavage/methylation domain-containing protein
MNLKFTNYRSYPLPLGGEGLRVRGKSNLGLCVSHSLRFMEKENPSNQGIGIGWKTLRNAFTLMEVMIAIGVFCIGVFAILDVVASVLHGARLLDKPMVDAGCLAGNVALTNSLVEVQDQSGDLSEFLGDQYKNYPYIYSITEVQSNHLYQVDMVLQSDAPGHPVISKMTMLLFRPQSPAGTLDGGMTGR